MLADRRRCRAVSTKKIFFELHDHNPQLCSETTNLRERRKNNFSYVSGLMTMLARLDDNAIAAFTSRASRLVVALADLVLIAPSQVQLQSLETIGRLVVVARLTTNGGDCATSMVKNVLVVAARALTLTIKDQLSHRVATATMAVRSRVLCFIREIL